MEEYPLILIAAALPGCPDGLLTTTPVVPLSSACKSVDGTRVEDAVLMGEMLSVMPGITSVMGNVAAMEGSVELLSAYWVTALP